MTTIKFKRPDGEASFDWSDDRLPGGCVIVRLDGDFLWNYSGPHERAAMLARMPRMSEDSQKAILLAAESIRNEKRALAKDEWRRADGIIWQWRNPTLTGAEGSTCGPRGFIRLKLVGSTWTKEEETAFREWHRATFLPILPDDCAYPPGQLPRRMTDDEVRFPDGSAQKMVYREWSGYGPPAGQDHYTHCIDTRVPGGDGFWWTPTTYAEFPMAPGHPAHEKSQLARLQSFWDANQPKEAELNLRWAPHSARPLVLFTGPASSEWSFDGTWIETYRSRLTLSQRATVEAFFAKGPPVELAEDEFFRDGMPTRMRMLDNLLQLGTHDEWMNDHWGRVGLAKKTASDKDPLGWPRALAYFDRHVGKPEPARVTDVRFDGERKLVCFRFSGFPFLFDGDWEGGIRWQGLPLKNSLHPLDIALIERCWKEGRLGEREVLLDDNRPGTVEPAGDGYLIRGEHFVCSLGTPDEWADTDHGMPSAWFGGQTLKDPTQRARVRAIVAGMQKEKERPACVPADVTEWTRIHGTVVWRERDFIRFERRPSSVTYHDAGWAIRRDFTFQECCVDGITPEFFHAARHWAGWEGQGKQEVTPSGEVKAPLEIVGRPVRVDECRLPNGDRRIQFTVPQEPAPDLTELREAQRVRQEYIDAVPWTARRPDILRRNEMQVLAAVERLVSK